MILLVDDDPDDRHLIIAALRQEGIDEDVVEADDGLKALDALKGPLPRLVFLDLKLPGLDGFEVLRLLRLEPRTKGVPVLALSGSDERSDIERVYELGASVCMRKPADFPRLFKDIAIAAHFWLDVNLPRSGR